MPMHFTTLFHHCSHHLSLIYHSSAPGCSSMGIINPLSFNTSKPPNLPLSNHLLHQTVDHSKQKNGGCSHLEAVVVIFTAVVQHLAAIHCRRAPGRAPVARPAAAIAPGASWGHASVGSDPHGRWATRPPCLGADVMAGPRSPGCPKNLHFS